MDVIEILLFGGKAIRGMFKLGFIPKEEDFREFPEAEYVSYKKKECDTSGSMTYTHPRLFHLPV